GQQLLPDVARELVELGRQISCKRHGKVSAGAARLLKILTNANAVGGKQSIAHSVSTLSKHQHDGCVHPHNMHPGMLDCFCSACSS
uniref:hypothetical protein n=1 Tax=Klebsiella pneumoniae TaxID=573 RepID=UPI0025A0B6A3